MKLTASICLAHQGLLDMLQHVLKTQFIVTGLCIEDSQKPKGIDNVRDVDLYGQALVDNVILHFGYSAALWHQGETWRINGGTFGFHDGEVPLDKGFGSATRKWLAWFNFQMSTYRDEKPDLREFPRLYGERGMAALGYTIVMDQELQRSYLASGKDVD